MSNSVIKNLLLLTVMMTVLGAQDAHADLKVFACEPEWRSLVEEIGADKVDVFAATHGLQDPHQVQARPSLIGKMRDADLLVCSGADLEIGWLPLLIRRSGNERLRPGRAAYFLAADKVKLLGIPPVIDRSLGDIHVAGNPHVHTSPTNIRLIAKALVRQMKFLDPVNADYYQQNADHFFSRWREATRRWKAMVKPLRGQKVIVQHASWDYLLDFAQMEQIATIEEKPGIPASSGQMSRLLKKIEGQKAKAIIRAAYQNGRSSQWLADKSGIKAVALPFTVGVNEAVTDLFSLFDRTFEILLDTIEPSKVLEPKGLKSLDSQQQ